MNRKPRILLGLGLGTLTAVACSVVAKVAHRFRSAKSKPSTAAPNVHQPRRLNWNDVTCSYPGNWRCIPLDDEGELDMGFCLESGGGSTFVLSRVKGANRLAKLEASQASQMEITQCDHVEKWGSMDGDGFHLTGMMKEAQVQVELQVFIPGPPFFNLAFTQLCNLEERDHIAPGFKLIQESISLDKARLSQA